MLNYRAFKATIVLKSYRDRLINLYDANALFQRLDLNAADRELLRCGDSLCFKKSIISVKGSHCKWPLKHHHGGRERECNFLRLANKFCPRSFCRKRSAFSPSTQQI
jgi:hypothetical protein